MGLKYNPAEKIEGGGKAEAGKYYFKVDEAGEATFSTGNEGLKVTLLVGAFDDRDVKVFCNFAYTPKALWRLKQFFDAIGVDFDNPPDAYDLVGKTGEAIFEVGDKGYLQVETYLPAGANNTSSKPKVPPKVQAKPKASEHDYGPPAMVDADVPF